MRHAKHTFKIGSSSSHRRCLIANMLKALIYHNRIRTSVAKAKELRRYADKMVTLAKTNTLATRRKAAGEMMIRFNQLSSKEARKAKEGNHSAYNADRVLLTKLFGELREKYQDRQGGYTRIIRDQSRRGDASEQCYIEYI